MLNYTVYDEVIWRNGGTVVLFLSLDIDGGELLISRSGRFTPMEGSSGTDTIRGSMVARGGLDATQ